MTNTDNCMYRATRHGGRMTKWKGRIASMAPMALFATVSVVALSIGTAAVATTISSALTSRQSFTTDQDHSITSTGSIMISSSSGAALTIVGDYSSAFTNDGTISATATSRSDITGLYLTGNLLAGGSIVNNGTVLVDYSYDSNDYITAYGVRVGGAVDGTLTNNGTITVAVQQLSNTDYELSAYGIYTDSVSATGQINNTGTIDVSAIGSNSSSISAYGIYVSNSLAGQINNSGTIKVLAKQNYTDSDVTAYGIYAYNVSATGQINNTGTIIVTAIESSNSRASAYGVYDSGSLAGEINNSGTIKVTAESTDYKAYGYGIRVGSSGVAVGGTIKNTGTINLNVTAYNDAVGYGIFVGGDLEGSIDNSGTIKLDVVSETYTASGYGIYINGNVTSNGSINNSGTIDVLARSVTEFDSTAYGIYVSGSLNGDLTNSGTIRAYALQPSSSNAYAYGIYVGSDVNAQISNSGTIDVKVSAPTSTANAYGMYLTGTTSGDISNSGTIIAQGSAILGSVTGVFANSFSGDFSNTGTITAKGVDGPDAYGLRFYNFSGTISNVGTISAVSNGGQAYAIYLSSSSSSSSEPFVGPTLSIAPPLSNTGTLNIVNTDVVTGLIHVDNQDVNLNSIAAQNSYFEFEDANTAAGVFTRIESGGSPWFVQDEGGSNPIYATYDQSLLTGQGLGMEQARGLSDHLGDLSNSVGTETVSKNFMTVSTKGTAGSAMEYHPFVQAMHAYAGYNTTSASKSYINTLALQGGVIFGLNNGGNVGFMLSGIDGHRQTNSRTTGFRENSSDSTGYAIDLAYTPNLSFGSVTFGASFGQLSEDQQRFVVGGTSANSSYNVNWYGASIKVAHAFNQGGQGSNGEGWSLIPSAKASITRVDFDGYTETGTAAALATVGSHSSTITEGEIGITMAKQFSASAVSMGISAFATNWSGSTASSVTLLGSTQAVNAVNQDLSGAALSLNLDSIKIAGGDFSVHTKTSFDSDGGVGTSITARFQMSF